MKHTKKRAILSAVAMLVVSAIALSSATFAWFSAGSAAGVNNLTATVTNDKGAVEISLDSTNWKRVITQTDIASLASVKPRDIQANGTGGYLDPVSINLATGGNTTVFKGEMTEAGLGQNFASAADPSTGYLKVTVYIRNTSAAALTATITPSFTAAKPFLYGGIIENGNIHYINAAAGRTYKPLGSTFTCTGEAGTTPNIIDSSDPGYQESWLKTDTTASALAQPFTMALAANGTVYSFEYYIWAEGQDTACLSSLFTGTADAQMGFSITAA